RNPWDFGWILGECSLGGDYRWWNLLAVRDARRISVNLDTAVVIDHRSNRCLDHGCRGGYHGVSGLEFQYSSSCSERLRTFQWFELYGVKRIAADGVDVCAVQ